MPIETMPQVESQLPRLSAIEKANLLFSTEIKRKLKEALPNASELPLVYIGSGGDLLTALLVSGSNRIVLVDSHPFLAKDGMKDDRSETYSTVEEMRAAVDPNTERIGVLTLWQSVRPAVQMIAHLEKIGVPPENIEINVQGADADLNIRLGSEVTVVHFRAGRIDSLQELQSLLDELSIQGDYGLLAKGGAASAIQTIVAEAEGREGAGPKYFVVDDPRQEALQTLSTEEEEKMYPGYSLIENKSKEDTAWGYSWGEEPNSKTAMQETEFDYQTRAVIGILKQTAA